MAFQAGNRFWEARSSHGRNPIFSDPEELWLSCVEYFEWVEANPLYEEKIFMFQGAIVRDTVAKMRAMTIEGLCLFLGIDRDTWSNYKKRDDFFGVTTRAESIIYEQKFTGAAADMLNPNIIARDLGLADRKDHSSTDGSMSPVGITVTFHDPDKAG